MADTASKIHYPTGEDLYQPHTDMDRLAHSIRHIVPVANVTERNALATEYNSTQGKPLYVDRADSGTIERNVGSGWQQIYPPVLDDTGWLDLDRGQLGYYSSGKYRVRGGWAILNVALECASTRPSGTVEIAPANPAYAHTGNNAMSGPELAITDSSATFTARVFQTGRVVGYGLPAMSTGQRIYGILTWPVG